MPKSLNVRRTFLIRWEPIRSTKYKPCIKELLGLFLSATRYLFFALSPLNHPQRFQLGYFF